MDPAEGKTTRLEGGGEEGDGWRRKGMGGGEGGVGGRRQGGGGKCTERR